MSSESYAAQTAIRASATAMKAAVKLESFDEEPKKERVPKHHQAIIQYIMEGADELIPYILEKNGEGNRQTTASRSDGGDGASNNNEIGPETWIMVYADKKKNPLSKYRDVFEEYEFKKGKLGYYKRMQKQTYDKMIETYDWLPKAVKLTTEKANKQG